MLDLLFLKLTDVVLMNQLVEVFTLLYSEFFVQDVFQLNGCR